MQINEAESVVMYEAMLQAISPAAITDPLRK